MEVGRWKQQMADFTPCLPVGMILNPSPEGEGNVLTNDIGI
jgi:hypothetical protein